MPVITLEAAQMSKDQKRRLARSLTEVASEILELPQKAFYIYLKENELDNVAVSGQLLSDLNQQ